MIGGLEAFPAYKDSGLPWLPEVPEHWSVRRLKYLFREVDLRTSTGEERLLSLRMRSGLVDHLLSGGKSLETSALIGYKVVGPGQLVMNRMRASTGLFAVARESGLVSPDYAVFDHGHDADPAFYVELFRTVAMGRVFRTESKGLGTGEAGFMRLYTDRFGNIGVPVPPLEEQNAIARFIDHTERRVRRYIRAKQKLIDLTEEQVDFKAAALMQHPGSSSERLETIASQQYRSVTRSNTQAYTALGLYNRGRGLFHKAPRPGAELGESTFYWVEPGDLVISGQFAWEGAVALARTAEANTIVSHRYHLLNGIEGRATTPYLLSLLRSDYGAMLLDQHSRGAAGRNRPLNLRTLLKERVPVPPYTAQLELDEFVRSLEPIRAQVTCEIALLREYRTRLIADVVTGKLDVRQVAGRIPEETEDYEPFDLADVGIGAEGATDELDPVLEEAEA